MSSFDQAIRIIQEHSRPKELLRKVVKNEFSQFYILSTSVDRKDYYRPSGLLKKVEISEKAFSKAGEEEGSRRILMEDEIGKGRFRYEPLGLDFKGLLAREKKVLLLGIPGIGKTECLKNIAFEMASRDFPIQGRHLLPVFISIRDWMSKDLEIEDYLAITRPYNCIPQTQWKEWVDGKDIFYFLDGWDEASEVGRPLFQKYLYPLLDSAHPVVLSCRTFTYEQYKYAIETRKIPVYYLDNLEKKERDIFIRKYKATGSHYNPDKLIKELDKNPGMSVLAGSPLVLSIICYLVDSRGISLPASRIEFYENAFESLLSEERKDIKINWPGKKPDYKDKLEILKKLVWKLWKQKPKELVYKKEEVEESLSGILGKKSKYRLKVDDWQSCFLEDFNLNSGLVRQEGKKLSYSFFHLTFIEYLVAACIGDFLRRDGWNKASVILEKKKKKVFDLLDEKRKDRLWDNVISFLSEAQGEFKDRVEEITAEDLARIPAGFIPLHKGVPQTYTCGGQTHTVHEYRHEKTGLEFVLIPSGTFLMGSNEYEDEQPIHAVRIGKPFLMSKTAVTQRAWKKVMGEENNPSDFKGDDLPVESVTWEEAREFCENAGLSLPSEAQWEYACRGGAGSAWYFGNDESKLGDYAWYDENSYSKTHPVGEKLPNALGLYDIMGNVWEWCMDACVYWGKGGDFNYNNVPCDGSANKSGSGRVIRGGSWGYGAVLCRSSARRGEHSPTDRWRTLGFRVCQAGF